MLVGLFPPIQGVRLEPTAAEGAIQAILSQVSARLDGRGASSTRTTTHGYTMVMLLLNLGTDLAGDLGEIFDPASGWP